MRAIPVAATLLAALLTPLAGCARDGGAPASDGPAPATAAPVVLTKSGGIVGLDDTVTVQPDGRWTRVDRAGASRTGRLSDADLDRLRQLATDSRLAAEAAATVPATMCADAFSYRLTVGPTTTGYVDCPPQATPPPATAALVDLLTRATG
ncbi:protealysin inhibitor emfourin [Micromonospora sp. MA102]|uniref:protealysin inhibitor emfourin n=1 Tax=Micromonospora sp. MA102 TaxID=2952755 RepID=UPI0021C823AD|nr:protealysin inhibitor emfourin [Micromonospora sp. MA102]